MQLPVRCAPAFTCNLNSPSSHAMLPRFPGPNCMHAALDVLGAETCSSATSISHMSYVTSSPSTLVPACMPRWMCSAQKRAAVLPPYLT